MSHLPDSRDPRLAAMENEFTEDFRSQHRELAGTLEDLREQLRLGVDLSVRPRLDPPTLRALLDHLGTLSRLRRDADTRIDAVVRTLRCEGISWTDIGAALVITRQSAWARFSEERT